MHCAALPTLAKAAADAQVPRVTLVAVPQEIGAGAKRTSMLAAPPLPSLTSVNVSVAVVSFVAATLKSDTAPGVVPDVDVDALRVETVSETDPTAVPLVAVIVVVPPDTPVASPLELIVATPVLLELQVTDPPVIAFPAALFRMAVNC